MERLANTKPLPIPERRPHPRPTFRDPTRSMLGWRSLALRWRRRLRGWRGLAEEAVGASLTRDDPRWSPPPEPGGEARRASASAQWSDARWGLPETDWRELYYSYAGGYRRARTPASTEGLERRSSVARRTRARKEGRKEGFMDTKHNVQTALPPTGIRLLRDLLLAI